MMEMDRILMEGMSFHNHTGVLDSEKKHGQTFEIDVELELPPIRACETDELADTISYSEAYGIIRTIFELEAYDLVERLCGVVAERLLDTFSQLAGVVVTVRKPNAPIDGAFRSMGVRIHRTRQNHPAGREADSIPEADTAGSPEADAACTRRPDLLGETSGDGAAPAASAADATGGLNLP